MKDTIQEALEQKFNELLFENVIVVTSTSQYNGYLFHIGKDYIRLVPAQTSIDHFIRKDLIISIEHK